MRRYRKPKPRFEVSLFPFLAVLICTVGVLIVLLMITVKSADVRAQTEQAVVEEAHEQEQKQLDEVQIQLEDQQIQVEGLDSVRPELLERLQNIRSHRAHLTDEVRRVEEMIARAAAQIEALDDKAAETPQEDVASEIERLRQAIESEVEARSVARAAYVENPPTMYSILPHEGPNGTIRRPIYIECTGSKIVLQPHQIELKSSDFAPPLEANNPLDTALVTIREYWSDLQLAGDQGDPYPLIVVRPTGANTYVMARRAMKSWDDEFGYELVSADKTLDFGPHDEQLKSEIEKAIEKARARKRQAVAAQVINRGNQLASGTYRQGQGRGGFRASSSLGGFVSEDGTPAHTSRDLAGNTNDQFENQAPNEFNSQRTDNQSSGDSDSTSSATHDATKQSESLAETAQPNGNPGPRKSSGGQPTSLNVSSLESSLAHQRGQNWALPNHTPGTTGYLRPITVYCSTDHLVIKSTNGNWKKIEFGGKTRQSVTPLVESVWQRIESWGTAGNGGYWKPELRLKVMPGGHQRAADLAALLGGSGLGIRIDTQPQSAGGR